MSGCGNFFTRSKTGVNALVATRRAASGKSTEPSLRGLHVGRVEEAAYDREQLRLVEQERVVAFIGGDFRERHAGTGCV